MKKTNSPRSGAKGTPNGTTIHPSSIKPGSGSGNLYRKSKPSIDNENPPRHSKYGV